MSVDPRRGVPASPSPNAIHAWLHRVRLRHWVHLLPLPLVTFDPHGGIDALLAAVRGIGIAFAILAFGYLLNSLSDRGMDLDARKNPLIAAGDDKHRWSLAALVCLSLGLAAISPWPVQVATAVCLVCGWGYSTGPRIKSIPIVGSLANLGNFAPLLFVGMAGTTLPRGFTGVAVVFGSLLLQNQLIHEAGDAVEDRRGGVRTTWLTLGRRATSLVAALLGLAAALAAARMVSPAGSTIAAGLVGAAFVAAFPALLAWRGEDPVEGARLRLAHRWCAVSVGAALFAAWRTGAP